MPHKAETFCVYLNVREREISINYTHPGICLRTIFIFFMKCRLSQAPVNSHTQTVEQRQPSLVIESVEHNKSELVRFTISLTI